MKKKLTALLVATGMAVSLAACGGSTSSPATTSTAAEESSAEDMAEAAADTSETAETEEKEDFKLIWVTCSTESDFWQYIQIGIENAVADMEEEYNLNIDFSVAGPATEAETEAYVRALENAIAAKPNAIVTATQIPESTSPLTREAMNQGIIVNLANCGLLDVDGNDTPDAYNEFYCTSNGEIGDAAGEWMVNKLTEMGYTEGYISVHNSNLNPAVQARMDNFRAYVEANSKFTVLDTLYNDNDLQQAQADVENQISAYGEELVGVYGCNNVSGDGAALAIENAGIADKVVSIGVDSDPTEVAALEAGNIDCIFVQTAYEQGYNCVKNAVETWKTGSNPESKQIVYTSPVPVTTENMHEEEFAALLDPTLLKK